MTRAFCFLWSFPSCRADDEDRTDNGKYGKYQAKKRFVVSRKTTRECVYAPDTVMGLGPLTKQYGRSKLVEATAYVPDLREDTVESTNFRSEDISDFPAIPKRNNRGLRHSPGGTD